MRVRTLYMLAGASCGFVLGAFAALAAVSYGLGLSWLFLFGDDPWPENSGRVILGGGIAVFAAVFLLLIGLGYRRGERLEARGAGADDVRRGAWLIAGSFALALVAVGAVALKARAEQRAILVRAAQDAAFAELHQRRHEITDWLSERREEAVDVHLLLAGSRGGRYRLSWVLSDGLYGTELLRDSTDLDLRPGAREITLELESALVASRYRERVLAGKGGVLVDDELPLRVTLEPLLSPAEAERLPSRERQNLSIGASALRYEIEHGVPFRFTLP